MESKTQDLMMQLCMRPTAALLKEQLALGRRHMPRDMPMHEVWTQTMNEALPTFNDALYFIFVFVVACPSYTQHVCEKSNKRAMDRFLPLLRKKFTALMLGRAPDDKRAESASHKEFQGSVDFTMAMRSCYLRA